jgi:hypothetical protein
MCEMRFVLIKEWWRLKGRLIVYNIPSFKFGGLSADSVPRWHRWPYSKMVCVKPVHGLRSESKVIQGKHHANDQSMFTELRIIIVSDVVVHINVYL